LEETILKDGIFYSLNDIESDCWQRLLNGSLRSKDPLHNPAVANVSGNRAVMRTVVLRKVITAEKKLFFHTDIRSFKWKDLQQNNHTSWLFYDSAARLQIRAAGQSSFHHNDEIADAAWQNTFPASRKIYMGEDGPSQKTNIPASGVPEAFLQNDPTLAESEAGRKNLAVVCTKINWVEWLWLSSKGHKRAEIVYEADESFRASWLIP
jgi:pyridoxamine 5'-phosphate oxidase